MTPTPFSGDENGDNTEDTTPLIPPGVIASMVVAGLLLITVVVLLVVLGLILFWKPRGAKRPKRKHSSAVEGDGRKLEDTLDYNGAYEMSQKREELGWNQNTNNINTIWNEAYLVWTRRKIHTGSGHPILTRKIFTGGGSPIVGGKMFIGGGAPVAGGRVFLAHSCVHPVRGGEGGGAGEGEEAVKQLEDIPLHDANDYEEVVD